MDAPKQTTSGFTNVTATPGLQEPHAHAYKMDEFGNGHTVGMIGSGAPHTHVIQAKQVHPSGADNHVHKLERGKPGQMVEGDV